jgi:hypothetical protein
VLNPSGFQPELRILNYYFRKTSRRATFFKGRESNFIDFNWLLGLRAKPALGSFTVLRRSGFAYDASGGSG